MIPAFQYAYVFLSTREVDTLQHIVWCRAATHSERGIFSDLSCSFVAKKASACASSGFCMPLFSLKKQANRLQIFAVLSGRTDASVLPIKFLTQPNVTFKFQS